MRLIDADALRAVVLDPPDPHTRWQRYHDVPALIDAAPTVCCETCSKWSEQHPALTSDLRMCESWGQYTSAGVGCSFWEEKT